MNFHEKQRNLFLFCAVEQAERAVFWPNRALNQVNRINTATLKVILFNIISFSTYKTKNILSFLYVQNVYLAHSKLCCSLVKSNNLLQDIPQSV
jgi:hypothetical protein